MTRLDAPPRAPRHAPDWQVEGRDWPHRAHSEFHRVGDHVWHVQRMGEGPPALLLHGTGASTHSWADLMDALGGEFETLAIDLPGHGFTQAGPGTRPSLPDMATAIAALLEALGTKPALMVGHSAGAALAIQLAGNSAFTPTHIVSINGALSPFPGWLSVVAPGMARALAFGGFAAKMFAQGARDAARVERLLHQTGSYPPPESVARYTALLRRPAHIEGTLNMMASWDLSRMKHQVGALDCPVLFLAGSGDATIPPADAKRMAAHAPLGQAELIDGLGHLAHEEDAPRIADAIRRFTGTPPPAA